jgi:hypothetical protein
MNTLRLESVVKSRQTPDRKDRMRVDVIAEFYVRVATANPAAVAATAQT